MARPAVRNFDLDEVVLAISIVNQVSVAVHTDHLRQLVQQASVLEERQRLARDLHDSVTRSLGGLAALSDAALEQAGQRQQAAASDLYRKIDRRPARPSGRCACSSTSCACRSWNRRG
jgi:signal transduction histidine kinase